jgi:hypothetical protein
MCDLRPNALDRTLQAAKMRSLLIRTIDWRAAPSPGLIYSRGNVGHFVPLPSEPSAQRAQPQQHDDAQGFSSDTPGGGVSWVGIV